MDRSLDVAVVGVGCLFPKAQGRNAYWANILAGVDAIREVPPTHWNAADYLNTDPKKPDHVYTARGGFLDPVDFDVLEFGVSPNNLEATDATQLLALTAVQQALHDAGYGPGGRTFDRKRTSVLLGVTGTLQLVIPLGARLGHPIWRKALKDAGVDPETAEDVVGRISDAYVPWQENSFPGLLGNVVAGRIANRFDFGGSNCVVDAACASSLAAVHLAAMELQSGRSDMVVTGGVDAFNDVFMYMCFSKTPALSPTGDARPFDQGSDGTILGEGLGILLLKRRADAERDGDRIYAVLKGIGTSSDGRGNAIYAPTAAGQKECLESAYTAAAVTPDTIELVEAHGTGTRVGDGVEVSALTEIYSKSKRKGTWCALGSVKSQIGHTKAAAGAAGLIKATLALHQKVLPPTIKVKKPLDPLASESTPFYVNTQPRPWVGSPDHPRRAGVSSFGFGGSNFHAVLEEHKPTKIEVAWDADVLLAAFSDSSSSALCSNVASWADAADVDNWDALRVACSKARKSFRTSDPHRIAVVFERHRQPELMLGELRRFASEWNAESFRESPLGVFAGNGAADGKTAFLFPGQGSQYVGMLRDLACRFPEMLEALTDAECEILSEEASADRLSDIVYPHPAFDDDTAAAQEDRLRATEWTQPALGAMCAGAFGVFNRFGVKADVFAGHSYGELVALHAAETFDAATLHRLSRFRGKVMADRTGERGGMLAVSAPVDEIERYLAESKSTLVVANRNAPRQSVLSGSRDAIDRAAESFGERNVRTHKLNVSAAFHSPLVADAAADFAGELANATFSTPSKPVYANTTARLYHADPDESRALLANQLARPVEFVELVRNMHANGVRTFIEVGPSAKLIGLVRSILGDAPHQTMAIDASSGKRSGTADLARTLAKVAALGHDVDLSAWDPAPPALKPAKSKSTVALTGANYVTPRPPRPPRELPKKPAATIPPSPKPIERPATSIVRKQPSPPPAVKTNTTRTTTAMTPSTPPSPDNDLLRDGILALQRAQQQTAELHKQFLENQAAAQETLLALLGQSSGPSARRSSTPPPVAERPVVAPPAIERPRITEARSNPATPAAAAASPTSNHVARPAVTPPTPTTPTIDVGGALLEIVAEKTGYPREMLNLEMGLDADLGIDSIKRVEILSALQERFPTTTRVAADQLGTLRTLGDVVLAMAPTGNGAVSREPLSVAALEARVDETADILLAVVAEKTGYPSEMLNLEMGLDADLGIDSIKRVEILSAVQERLPQCRAVAADQLGTLRTLADVAAALSPANSNGAKSQPSVSPTTSADLSPVVDAELGDLLLKIVADKTGYPVEMLNLEMGLDADLGIDSIKRVEILSSLQEAAPSLTPLSADRLGALRTLGDVVAAFQKPTVASVQVDQNKAADTATPVAPRSSQALDLYVPLCKPLDERGRPRLSLKSGAVVWVVGAPSTRRDGIADALRRRNLQAMAVSVDEALSLECGDGASGLIFVADEKQPLDQPHEALAVLKKCAPSLQLSGARRRAMLGALVDFGGSFGLDGDAPFVGEPRQAALMGLVKTARFEWPNVACKVVDADAGADSEDVAEEFLTEGPIEVGMRAGARSQILLDRTTTGAGNGETPIKPRDLVVVTGGGRGVTAAVAEAFAHRFRPTLALLGRSRLVEEPDWLRGVEAESEIKRLLLSRAEDRPTPRQLGERCRSVLAQREIRKNLSAIEQAGARAVYRSVDVCDRKKLDEVVAGLRAEFGPVCGVIHGAGVLADRFIVEKSVDDYSRVFNTKVEGAENLLAAVGADPLRLLAFFSSSTARFGRKGQSDYAAANETLNKIAQRERRRRSGCRVLSMNWGPWDGGMVNDGLKTLFAAEGIAVIPQTAGADLLADLAEGRGGDAVEIVVLGKGSRTPEQSPSANGSAAGVDPSLGSSPAFERDVDVASHSMLRSHVIKGKAVVPAALMMEWLAHAALVRNPGLNVVGVDDFRVLSGIKLDETDRVRLSAYTAKAQRHGDSFSVRCELRSDRDGKPTPHAQCNIRLANRLPGDISESRLSEPAGEEISVAAAYGEFLFHGPALHAFNESPTVGPSGASALLRGAPDPADWFDRPIRSRWLTGPLAVDAAFQLAILWSRVNHDAACLPTRIGAYRRFKEEAGEPTRVVGSFAQSNPNACVGDFEFIGSNGNVVARLEGCEFVVDRSLNDAFKRPECSAGS